MNLKKLKKLFGLEKIFIKKDYPLDLQFCKLKTNIQFFETPNPEYHISSGLFIFNIKNHAKFLKFFFKYKNNYKSLTGGDQVHFSLQCFKI